MVNAIRIWIPNNVQGINFSVIENIVRNNEATPRILEDKYLASVDDNNFEKAGVYNKAGRINLDNTLIVYRTVFKKLFSGEVIGITYGINLIF